MGLTNQTHLLCKIVLVLAAVQCLGLGLEEADGDEGSIFFVGKYGSIESRDSSISVTGSAMIPDMTHSFAVRAATITPDGRRLVFAVSDESHPLIALDAQTLKQIDMGDIPFPRPKRPYLYHLPLAVVAPTNRYLYWLDESFTPEPDSYSSLIIDLERHDVRRIKDVAFSHITKDRVSPSGEYMLGLWGDQPQLIEVATGVVKRTFNENSKHYRAFGLEVDWASEAVQMTLQWNPATKEVEYSVLNIDLRLGAATKTTIERPKVAALMKHDTKLGRVLLAYNEALAGASGDFPLLTPHIRALMEKLDEEVLAVVPEPFSEIYVSPDLRHLFVCYYEQSERSVDDSEFISTITVVGLNSKSVVSEVELLYQLQTILFR